MAGVTLTFDMHPKWEEPDWWTTPMFYNGQNIFDLLESYGVRATFFISQLDYVNLDTERARKWQNIISRVALTHEIGGHSLSHPSSPGMDGYRYFETQVYPNYVQYYLLRQKPGNQHWPARWPCFAYPDDVADASVNMVLLNVFDRLRGNHATDGMGPLTPAQVQVDSTIAGGWLDRFSYSGPFGIPAWRQGMFEWLNDTGRIGGQVVFASHMPSWYAGSPSNPNPKWTDPTVMLQFISYVNNETNLTWTPMGELPALTNRSDEKIPAQLKKELARLKELADSVS